MNIYDNIFFEDNESVNNNKKVDNKEIYDKEVKRLNIEYEEKKRKLDYEFEQNLTNLKNKFNQKNKIKIINNKNPLFIWEINRTQTSYGINGTTGCGAISLLTIYHHSRLKNKDVEPMNIDWFLVMKNGSELWSHWQKNQKPGRDFHDLYELFKIEELKNLRKKITLINEINGPIHNQSEFEKIKLNKLKNESGGFFMSLDDAIEKLFLKGKNNYASITIRGSTFTLINNNDDEVWLFDSHNNSIKPGYSILAVFYNENSLVNYLRDKFPIRYNINNSILINNNPILKSTFNLTNTNTNNVEFIYQDDNNQMENNFFLIFFKKN